MATILPIENDDKMVNAILGLIRLQSFDVKDKIQRILSTEIDEERIKQSEGAVTTDYPQTMSDLRGILKDDGLTGSCP